MSNEIIDTKLSTKQQQAIQLLSSGDSITNVAKKLEVDRTTIYRWMNEKEFNRELDKLTETYTNSLFFQAVAELEGILQRGRDVDKLRAIELVMGLNGRNISKSSNNVNFVKVEKPEITVDQILREIDNMQF